MNCGALPTCGVHAVEHELVVHCSICAQETAAAICTG